MNRQVWEAKTEVPGHWDAAKLAALTEDINARPSLTGFYHAATRTLTVYLHEPSTLRDAPSGTHDWAEGWLMHRDAWFVSAIMRKPVDWVPVKWYDDGRVIQDSGTIRQPFTL